MEDGDGTKRIEGREIAEMETLGEVEGGEARGVMMIDEAEVVQSKDGGGMIRLEGHEDLNTSATPTFTPTQSHSTIPPDPIDSRPQPHFSSPSTQDRSIALAEAKGDTDHQPDVDMDGTISQQERSSSEMGNESRSNGTHQFEQQVTIGEKENDIQLGDIVGAGKADKEEHGKEVSEITDDDVDMDKAGPNLASLERNLIAPTDLPHNTSATDLSTSLHDDNIDNSSRATSSPVIPLSTSDPLISSRLSALSTIRDVLGDEVLRSLPVVQQARTSMDLERERRSSVATIAGPRGEEPHEGRDVSAEGTEAVGVDLAPETKSLLEALDGSKTQEQEMDEAKAAADAVMAVDDDNNGESSPAATNTQRSAGGHQNDFAYTPVSAPLISARATAPSLSTTPSAELRSPIRPGLSAAAGTGEFIRRHSTLSTATSSSTGRSGGRSSDRDGQIGRVASRLSGWLGLNNAGTGADMRHDESNAPSITGATSGSLSGDSAAESTARDSFGNSFSQSLPERQAATSGVPNTAAPVPSAPPRIRQGATLIIQGFVQTSMPSRSATEDDTNPAATSNERSRPSTISDGPSSSARWGELDEITSTSAPSAEDSLRRTSSAGGPGATSRPAGFFGRNRRDRAEQPSTPPPFAQQARMLGGLLSVATAATAASLLTPPGQPSPLTRPTTERTASGARSTLETIRNRLRSGGSDGSSVSDTMDEALREYMRHAMDPDREVGQWSDPPTTGPDAPQGGFVAGPDGPVPAPNASSGPAPIARSRLRSILPNTDSDLFEAFLDSMQNDLTTLLREYVEGSAEATSTPRSVSGSTGNLVSTATTPVDLPQSSDTDTMDVDPAAIPLPDDDDDIEVDEALDMLAEPEVDLEALERSRPGTPYNRVFAEMDDEDDRMSIDADPATSENTAVNAATPGHTSPADANSTSRPRRFNFFRMFQFPVREQDPANGLAVTAENPIQRLIPVLIIGVRSLNRDISTMGSEDTTNTPFLFGDDDDDDTFDTGTSGETGGNRNNSSPATSPLLDTLSNPNSQTPITTSPTVASTSLPGLEAPDQERTGGWGSRALRALGRHRRNDEADRRTRRSLFSGPGSSSHSRRPASTPADASDPHGRNYVLWVFGGHYPPGHPILTIPQLFTGMGNLSHDDLWALAEALGQAKPPTASKEDIKKSGLKEFKGSEIGTVVKSGEVMENCEERCLVSSSVPHRRVGLHAIADTN